MKTSIGDEKSFDPRFADEVTRAYLMQIDLNGEKVMIWNRGGGTWAVQSVRILSCQILV